MEAVDFCDAYGGSLITPSTKKFQYQFLWIMSCNYKQQ